METVYKAFDGKEFKDAEKCMMYGTADSVVLTGQDFGELTGDKNVVNYMDFIK